MLKKLILNIYAKSSKRLGAQKIAVCLQRDHCISISYGRVYRLMKTMNLPSMSTVKPAFKHAKSRDGEPMKNVLNQRFNPGSINQVWVSDFTYLKAGGRTYYLCVILDLFARKVIAHRLSSRIDKHPAIQTLHDAVASRSIKPGLIFHSDRGSQYTSFDFRKELDALNIIQSFSKKGHPYDNAVMECFFKYLKKDETNKASVLLVCVLCISFIATTASAGIIPFQSTIFSNYDVYIPASMNAEFHAATRKSVSSVSISTTMQVQENGVWKNYSTGISPAFSGSNKASWTTTADYSSACAKGAKYRLVVTYSSSGASASYTSNERSY